MKLSVVIPVYNEKETILEVIDKVAATPFDKEIIVIDDCSGDGTTEVLKSLEREDTRVFYHEVNQGKGAALRTGFKEARGDIVLVQDADLEYTPDDYGILLKPIEEGQADVVYGSRFQAGVHRCHLFWHYVVNKSLTLFSNMLTNINLTDMETCYKVFRREVIQSINITSNRFGVEPEITAKVARLRLANKRCRIYEVPISYFGRDYAEGKKIGWKDGVQALWCILKYNIFDRRM